MIAGSGDRIASKKSIAMMITGIIHASRNDFIEKITRDDTPQAA
jgi:hypothetical protein